MITKTAVIVLSLVFASSSFGQHKWVRLNSPAQGMHQAIDFFSSDAGYLIIDSLLYFSSDGGSTWSTGRLLPHYERDMFMHFSNTDTGTIHAFIPQDIYHTTDGGMTWVKNNSKLLDSLTVSLTFFNFSSGSLFGVIENKCSKCVDFRGGIIPFTTNGGIDWNIRKTDSSSKVAMDDVARFAFRSPKIGMAVLLDDVLGLFSVAVTTDSGAHWSRSDSGIQSSDMNVGNTASINYLENGTWLASYYYWVSKYSTFYTSTDDGMSWNYLSSIYNSHIQTTFFSDNVGFTVEGDYSTSDYGRTWSKEDIPALARVKQFSVPSTRVAFCITDSEIFKTDLSNSVTMLSSVTTLQILFNPVYSHADFTFETVAVPTSLEIFDALGRRVMAETIPAGTTSYRADVSRVAAGVYLARIGVKAVRFVKQ
jgi:photosystem II stability/assembly factor-like uncharacterized protein